MRKYPEHVNGLVKEAGFSMLFLSEFFVFQMGPGWMSGMEHMMDWWGIPFMGFWMIGVWLVFVVIAFFVYKDAKERGMNELLWFILVVLPWIGILFLIIYLLVREEKKPQQPSQKSAEQILDERYARGEITREEYQQKSQDLRQRK